MILSNLKNFYSISNSPSGVWNFTPPAAVVTPQISEVTSSLQNIMMTEKVEKEEQMRMRKKSLNTIQVSLIKNIKPIIKWKSSTC